MNQDCKDLNINPICNSCKFHSAQCDIKTYFNMFNERWVQNEQTLKEFIIDCIDDDWDISTSSIYFIAALQYYFPSVYEAYLKYRILK